MFRTLNEVQPPQVPGPQDIIRDQKAKDPGIREEPTMEQD